MHFGRMLGIVQQSPFGTAIGKRPRNADRAKRLEPVSILHGGPFGSGHGSRYARALEREAVDDGTNVINAVRFEIQKTQPAPGRTRAGLIAPAMKLPIRDVVQESGKLHNVEIGSFLTRNSQGI